MPCLSLAFEGSFMLVNSMTKITSLRRLIRIGWFKLEGYRMVENGGVSIDDW